MKMEPGEYNKRTKRFLYRINAYQDEINKINSKIQNEINQTEKKFDQLKKPHLKLREDAIKKIPNFWSKTFVNHPLLANFFNDQIIKYFSKLEVQNNCDLDGSYNLEFHFNTNPYFKNKMLKKEYRLDTLGCTVSTNLLIDWKKQINLPFSKSKDCSYEKQITKFGSFWEWYNKNENNNDIFADVIKDELWIDPLKYFVLSDKTNIKGAKPENEDDAHYLGIGTSDEGR